MARRSTTIWLVNRHGHDHSLAVGAVHEIQISELDPSRVELVGRLAVQDQVHPVEVNGDLVLMTGLDRLAGGWILRRGSR
jgi:hypothetical protein